MKRHIIPVIAFLFVLSLNIYYRSFPINLPQFKKQAEAVVEQKIYLNTIREIDKKFAGFSEPAKSSLVKTFFNDYKKKQKQEIKREINEEYVKLKDRYQDKYGQTYLMELDCWHWGRYVENVYRLGHPGDIVINGKQHDILMMAPQGQDLLWENFLFYASSFLYKIARFFINIPLNTFLFYLPLFFITLLMIALYFFSLHFYGIFAAVISCLFVGLAPIFLPRSCAGWFDMDILNLLLPLLAVFSYLTVYETSNLKLKIFRIFLSSFWIGLFCFTWTAWWFVMLIILLYEIYSLLDLVSAHLQYKEDISLCFKEHLISLGLFLPFTLFWIIIFSGLQPIEFLYYQVKAAVILNNPLTGSIWPNTFSTVGELKKADFLSIAHSVGGYLLFILSLFAMLLLVLNNKRYAGAKRESIFLFVIWFFIVFLACFKGIRFTMFLLIPLGIFLGWGIGEISKIARAKKKIWLTVLLIIFLIILGNEFTTNAYRAATGMLPLMDDLWYSVLTVLKDKTHPQAIIDSWWDCGDWFKAVSGRRVIFDGHSQNTPQAYWMGRVLLTDNEQEAMGILRMLNNGGNRAYEIMNEYVKDPFQTLFLLKRIILLEPQKGKEELSNFLPSNIVEQISRLIYAKPGKAYFIVDSSMMGKMSSISFLGNWDLVKLYLTQNIRKKTKDQIIDYLVRLGIERQQVEKLYQEAVLISPENLENWISRRFMFYSFYVKGKVKDSMVLFDNGFIYNPKEQTVYSYSPQDGKYKIPRSLFIKKADNLIEIVYPNNDFDSSLLILEKPQGYELTMLSRELANSLFVRLHFFDGMGLKHFIPFAAEKDEGESVSVFEINWD